MVLAKRKEGSRVGHMTPTEKKTTTESIELYGKRWRGITTLRNP
jgi:hypothetical protein